MSDLLTYALDDGVATIIMDDGKANALSEAMLGAVGEALDRAAADGAVVVLTGRERTFSGGFDLRTPPEGWPPMLIAGASVAEQLLRHPHPVVAACNGNAVAMGAFLLLAADHRVGAAGEFRIGLPEVAIGLTMPYFGIALARHRLTRPAYDHCTITGDMLGPDAAREAGFLDELVAADALEGTAQAAARRLAGINQSAHAATKLRVREPVLAGVRDGIERLRAGDPANF